MRSFTLSAKLFFHEIYASLKWRHSTVMRLGDAYNFIIIYHLTVHISLLIMFIVSYLFLHIYSYLICRMQLFFTLHHLKVNILISVNMSCH